MKSLAWGMFSLVALAATPGSAATTIGTGPALSGGSIAFIGRNLETLGQSFTAQGGFLTQFTFHRALGTGNVRLAVAALVGNTLGEELYSSSAVSLASGGSVLTFSGIDLAVRPLTSYVAYLTATGVDAPTRNGRLATSSVDYIGGTAGYTFPGDRTFSPEVRDLAFSATFAETASAIPEPESWGLMIAGFALVGAGLRCRRRVRIAYH